MGTVMGTAARAAGLPRVVELAEAEAAAQALRGFVRVGDVVLVKASRVARLERVSDALVPLETRHAPAVGRRPSV
jgi:UDP-N-acetylmuramyl pentapeptide synthase